MRRKSWAAVRHCFRFRIPRLFFASHIFITWPSHYSENDTLCVRERRRRQRLMTPFRFLYQCPSQVQTFPEIHKSQPRPAPSYRALSTKLLRGATSSPFAQQNTKHDHFVGVWPDPWNQLLFIQPIANRATWRYRLRGQQRSMAQSSQYSGYVYVRKVGHSSYPAHTRAEGVCHAKAAQALQWIIRQAVSRGQLSDTDADPILSVCLQSQHELIFSVINPDSLAYLEKASSEARDSNLGVIIRPLPNMASTASIAGPNILVRELQFSCDVINVWLKTYRSKINKAGRKTMEQFPPMDHSRFMYLSLIEYVTESWRTVFIGTKAHASPVALAWKTVSKDGPGVWSIIELPGSSTLISGGLGSYAVSFN